MEQMYPNGCKSDGQTNNWYNQAQWINQKDASFIHDLRREFIFDNNGTFVQGSARFQSKVKFNFSRYAVISFWYKIKKIVKKEEESLIHLD